MKSLRQFCSPLAAITVSAAIFVLGGCAGMTSQEKGTVTGAVVGGVAGNLLCGGLACTAAGAAVGGVVGNQMSK
jgi:osmotically inducible lipoprotein OsmB